MDAKRPDPDRLLARITEGDGDETEGARRGRLKIFFGAAPGVGKTYAMLEESRARLSEGADVLVGWAETHGRAETEALLAGLSVLPPRVIDYRGRALREFDLDAALARRPRLILLDELAHSNVAGSRHEKRWQDAEELLASGIDVFTTINVQHLESVNDIVAQTTGVVVRETVPDRLFENADEIELVDLTPDDLLKRLREGKVYLPEAAERAAQNFFSKGNLIALRELALRRAVERVDAQMRSYKDREGIEAVWPLKERLLVCVSPSPSSAQVVRAAARMAAGLGAEWIVAHVEKPGKLRESGENQRRLVQTLRLAEQLGAEVVSLFGHSASDEVLAYARSRNVTKIVVGKPRGHWWRYRLLGSVVEDLVRRSDDIDVYVIRGAEEGRGAGLPPGLRRQTPWHRYLWSLPVVIACILAARLLAHAFAPTNLVMIYLLGVVFVAVRLGRGPSMLAAVLSVLAFDFFSVPPRLTLAVRDTEYLLTFAALLVVGILIGTIAGRLRAQAETSRERERRTTALYRISRDFSQAEGLAKVARIAEERIGEVLGAEVWILLPDQGGDLQPAPGLMADFPLRPEERAVARWVFDRGLVAGRGTATLPAAQAVYVPLLASGRTLGVLGLFPGEEPDWGDPERLHFIEALASQTALVLERIRLAGETQKAAFRAESERLKDSLLRSVSHDLRTPLGTITGAASSLADPDSPLAEEAKRELAQSIWVEAQRLNRLVANLLSMSRLESGAMRLTRDWHPIDEVIGSALTRLGRVLSDRPVGIEVPEDLPMVWIDGVLIEQVLINLLENAIKYTPPESAIDVRARVDESNLVIEVADRGPGLPAGSEESIFTPFQRLDDGPGTKGAGLGLAICKGFVEAHGGSVRAENRPGGGAVFRFALPLAGQPPPMPAVEEESAA
jgi:two-component system sensor histidine kinase KdpD